MSKITRTRAKVLTIAFLFLVAPLARAEDPNPGTMRVDAQIELAANGDGSAHVVLDFSARDYSNVKSKFPNPFQFLRDFQSNRANFELAPGAVCRYDDASSSVVMDITEKGSMRNRGNGVWELQIQPGPEFVNLRTEPDGRTALYFYEHGEMVQGIPYRGQLIYRLPATAGSAEWDPSRRIVRFQLPYTGPNGQPRLAHDLQVKERMMTAIYKVYGLGVDFAAMWVAKSVFRNTGDGLIRNLQVRYRLDGYSDWSMWETAEEVIPGQTVVSLYYPVLDKSIARIRSNSPANVLVEWRYEDARGGQQEGRDGRRVVLLGGNEFVFSSLTSGDSNGTFADLHNNAPFLAAWVSRDDPVIKQFAAIANKMARGIDATSDDESALKALAACYDLMVASGITYQHPPSLVDRSLSFDAQLVQNVKFPRDVLRDGSGTCIDLAILYAAMANAIGLEPYLALVPGHCFPFVKLPGGGYAAVETAGVRGGPNGDAMSFATALKDGNEKLSKWIADGRIYTIDLQGLWTKGISNPELETLPSDILAQWGRIPSAADPQASQLTPAPQPGPAPRPDPAPQPAPIPVPSFEGVWGGTVSKRFPTGHTITYPVTLVLEYRGNGQYVGAFRAQATVPTVSGWVDVRVDEEFVGAVQNGVLTLVGQRKHRTWLNTGVVEAMLLDTCILSTNGGQLLARGGNDVEGYTSFTLARQ